MVNISVADDVSVRMLLIHAYCCVHVQLCTNFGKTNLTCWTSTPLRGGETLVIHDGIYHLVLTRHRLCYLCAHQNSTNTAAVANPRELALASLRHIAPPPDSARWLTALLNETNRTPSICTA